MLKKINNNTFSQCIYKLEILNYFPQKEFSRSNLEILLYFLVFLVGY